MPRCTWREGRDRESDALGRLLMKTHSILLQLQARNRSSVYRIRSINDAKCSCPGIEVGERSVVTETRSPEYFDRSVYHRACHGRNGGLDARNLPSSGLRARFVDEPGCMKNVEASLIYFDSRPGDQILDHSKV